MNISLYIFHTTIFFINNLNVETEFETAPPI